MIGPIPSPMIRVDALPAAVERNLAAGCNCGACPACLTRGREAFAALRRAAAPEHGDFMPQRREHAQAALTPEERERLRRLQERDREVRARTALLERLGIALGGQLRQVEGPDGEQYAVDWNDTNLTDRSAALHWWARWVGKATLAAPNPSPEDQALARRVELASRVHRVYALSPEMRGLLFDVAA